MIHMKLILRVLVFLVYSVHSFAYQNTQFKDGPTFDFIVVGGGVGGCVVAGRLAESGKHSVLLIHEGGIPNDNLYIPALSSNKRDYPNDMKYYNTVPMKNANLVNNGVVRFFIGKSIGGGSSVNGQFWNRGNPQDYNNWAKILNDSSWNYENMLPFFKKTENYRGFNPTDQRGYGGPISVENLQNVKHAIPEFIEAGKELGYPFGDANGAQTPSVTLMDISMNRGRRANAFAGYIGPLLRYDKPQLQFKQKKSSNLVILLNTEAKRIIFEGIKATGVTYLNLNSSQHGFVKAKKEIILSAGAMDSPAVLMRSGIGPQSVLDSAKIPAVKYMEGVGKNLQDHVSMRHTLIFGNRSAVFVPSRDLTPETWKEYQEFGTGPYSVIHGAGAQGFFLSSLQSRKAPLETLWPDIHIMMMSVEVPFPGTKENEAAVSWPVENIRNKSKGKVTLDQRNTDNPPLIDFNYFDHPDDMRTMIDLLKLTDKMCQETSAMRTIGCRLPTTPLTTCNHFPFRSDSYYQCSIRQRSTTGFHAAGTCKMGTKYDPEAVVDSKLKVIGIQNVRIADASIMPELTNANTQAPTYAIGERAADMILNDWANDYPYPLNLNFNSEDILLKLVGI